MILSVIVARSQNNVIGKNNDLPWCLKEDLKNFKKITTGHPIIMGRKTYESIGKPLPGRTNIIVTRQKKYSVEGCEVVNSFEEAIQVAKRSNARETFLIGGAELINEFINKVDKIYLTEIHAEIEGDTYLTSIQLNQWQEVSRRDFTKAEGVNDYDFSVVEYVRNVEC